MSITRRALSLATAGLMLGLASSQAMADQLQDILDAGKIRVGVIADVAPFGFVDADQKPAGLDVDITHDRRRSRRRGRDRPVAAQNRIPYLVTDKVDVLVAILSLTPERAKQIMFTAPYASTSIGIFRRARDRGLRTGRAPGRQVDRRRPRHGRGRGTHGLHADADIVRFEDNATATTAYLSGQVDYTTTDILAYELNKGDGRKLEIKVPFGADLAHMGVKANEFGSLRGSIRSSIPTGPAVTSTTSASSG